LAKSTLIPTAAMTQPQVEDPNTKYLRANLSRMNSQEITALNQQALATLLFVYGDGENEYSEEDCRDFPGLREKSRIMHRYMRNYMVLDFLRCSGYIEGEGSRESRWNKAFLTEKGLEKAKQLYESFISNSYEVIISF
jgi:hypothetical protein